MKKFSDYATLVLFLCLLFGFTVAFWTLPDLSFSEQENRSLRTFPSFAWSKLFSGAYADDLNDYFADQFPLRDTLVGRKGTAELLQGKGENNGILLGEGGVLARRRFAMYHADGHVEEKTDRTDLSHIRASADGIKRADTNLSAPLTVMLTGRNIDVCRSSFDYPTEESDALYRTLYQRLGEEVSYVDMVPLLRKKHDEGESVYYKTDHHWTTRGAYYAYAELMRAWGMENDILPEDAFLQTTVSTEFYGTLWSAGGMKFVAPDCMELWYRGNEAAFSVTADGKELDGFYELSHLSKKDKYSVFLDGVHEVVTVRLKDGDARPTLVLFKDSFANSLAPFLAQHFDLVLLNLSSVRTDYTDLSGYAELYDADRVLLIYTVENMITADRLTRLR